MRCFTFELNCSARAIRVSSQRSDGFVQPIRRRTSQQIVSPPQIQITKQVRPPRAARALCRFGESDFPCVFEIVHESEGKN